MNTEIGEPEVERPSRYETLRAIPTRFDGIVYRSRLEARWAAFFTRLGLDFVYEPEGYDLGGGSGWYLPDFAIRTWGIFAEVKPEDPIPGEIAKCRKLAKLSDRAVLLLIGQPSIPTAKIFFANGFEATSSLAVCRRCPSIVTAYEGEIRDASGHGTTAFGCCRHENGPSYCTDKMPTPWAGTELAAEWAQNQKFGGR